MAENSIDTDYLVIGAGAMGMAFADALLTESNAEVVLVDRHHRPGGHWNDAYPFVRLHQASACYGVASLPLGRDTKDEHGLNRGLYEVATAAEICGYFDQVMQQKLLPTGRCRYFPSCNYLGDGRFVSLVSGAEYAVSARKAVVDATYTNTDVPATHEPAYAVAPGIRSVPPNDLVHVQAPPSAYVVIGAGKTAIDTCLWLLENGVDPQMIRWIKPREAWLNDRRFFQPGDLVAGTAEGIALVMVEAKYSDLASKNEICEAIPYPERDVDWLRMTLAGIMSQYRWSCDKELRSWLESCRLNVYRGMSSLAKADAETARFLQRSRDSAMAATMKLQQFTAEGALG